VISASDSDNNCRPVSSDHITLHYKIQIL